MPSNHSAAALWHNLVLEAEERLGTRLGEDVESYLVFMLMRYLRDAGVVRRIVALAFLEGMQKQGRARAEAMQSLGDQCLLFAGFFPEQARRRRVSLDYFVKMGRSAYGQLDAQPIFTALAQHFVPLMDVLAQIRATNPHHRAPSLLDLQELWESTGSRYAAKRLQEEGILPQAMPSQRRH